MILSLAVHSRKSRPTNNDGQLTVAKLLNGKSMQIIWIRQWQWKNQGRMASHGFPESMGGNEVTPASKSRQLSDEERRLHLLIGRKGAATASGPLYPQGWQGHVLVVPGPADPNRPVCRVNVSGSFMSCTSDFWAPYSHSVHLKA